MKIAIVGAGNMGSAIARGFSKSKQIQACDIYVSNPNIDKLNALQAEIPDINISTDNIATVSQGDIIILAVKPWKVEEVATEIKEVIDCKHQVVASIAAGIGTDRLKALLDKGNGCTPTVYYIIPNTAVAVLSSMTFISSSGSTAEQDTQMLTLFKELGDAMIVEERLMGAATALASCGIAYAMRYIRAATEGGVELGFYAKDAQHIVMQTIKGAVDLLVANDSHPEKEIDKVTTPGGLTIRGLNAMEENGFTASVIKGLRASIR